MNLEIIGIRWIDGSYLRLVFAYVMACKVMLWWAIRADFLYVFRKSSLVTQKTKLFPSFLHYPTIKPFILVCNTEVRISCLAGKLCLCSLALVKDFQIPFKGLFKAFKSAWH